MNDPTLTFKTRRKHHPLLLTCLVILINNVASMAMPISCPEPCECYLNYNGLQSARCSEIYQNQTAFPNIHVLVLRMSESQSQCHIPKDIHVILPQLNYLYMMNCSLTSIPLDSLDSLHHLQEIDISNNYIKKLDPLVFVKNNKLSYANLQNNPFHVSDRPFLISKSIRELDLSSCGITELPENMFKNLTHLKHLFLNDNKLSTIGENTIPNSVRVLNLSKNNIKKVPEVELMRLKKIRQIDLSENPVNCTCSLINLQEYLSGNAIMFTNDIDCRYPREYRGYKLSKLPEKELCDYRIAAEVEAGDDDDEDDEAAQSNQIIIEEESPKKKDNVQDDFERDQVVPVDKYYKPDDTEHYQSDSLSDEGSGDGYSQTDIPEDTTKIETSSEEVMKSNSNNNESNETNPDGTNQSPVEEKPIEPEVTTEPPVNENKNDVTSYKKELASTGTEDDTNKDSKPEPEIIDSEKSTESSSVSSTSESQTPIPPEVRKPDTEKSSTSHPASESSPVQSNSDPQTPETEETTQSVGSTDVEQHPSGATTPASPSGELPSNPNQPSAVDNKTSPDVSAAPPAQLQKDNSDSVFNLGYIIPCLAIIIVIIICLGIYLGQRSSHKNWEPNNTNGNDGAELQDVSLLPDKSKMPIVKNKKYPSEGNTEQTERLMNEADDPSAPKSVWEHLEEPIENGTSNHTKDSDKLPNGHTIDKNEPIECAVAKVTTLPDSVPRTPIIRNT